MVVKATNCFLAYVAGYYHQRPRDAIKTVVLAHFTKEEILTAKESLWSACKDMNVLDKMVNRVGTPSRDAEEANTEDILAAFAKIYALPASPVITMEAKDVIRLPKFAPGELIEPSVASRLAVVETQLTQLISQMTASDAKQLELSERVNKISLTPREKSPSFSEIVKQGTTQHSKPSESDSAKPKCDNTPQQNTGSLKSGLYVKLPPLQKIPASTNKATKQPVQSKPNSLCTGGYNQHQSTESTSRHRESDFQVPKYLQRKAERRDKHKSVTGTGVPNDKLKAAPKPEATKELFIANVSKDVNTSGLKQFIEGQGIQVKSLKRVSHDNARCNSFHLTVESSDDEKLFNGDIWPEGIVVRRFRYKQNSRFHANAWYNNTW